MLSPSSSRRDAASGDLPGCPASLEQGLAQSVEGEADLARSRLLTQVVLSADERRGVEDFPLPLCLFATCAPAEELANAKIASFLMSFASGRRPGDGDGVGQARCYPIRRGKRRAGCVATATSCRGGEVLARAANRLGLEFVPAAPE